MTMPAPTLWPAPDGTPIACREKLRRLGENHDELAQVMQDAFDDAMLMGVDDGAFRTVLVGLVASLRSPYRAG
jgi:hypothetical protein